MKKSSYGLAALLMLLPASSFAQSVPQPPASWVAFEQQENAKRTAFMQEQGSERAAFLNSHPDVKAWLDQMHVVEQARREAWMAAHRKPGT